MANAREVKQRIKSVKNISQVTRALQAVSSSKVRKAIDQLEDTRPYSVKAWQVLKHISEQPDRSSLHPLLDHHQEVKSVIAIVVSSDRGLAGPYNSNLIRAADVWAETIDVPVKYITVGKRGRDQLLRRGKDILAEFSNLPPEPSYTDISTVGTIAVDQFLDDVVDEVYLIYTQFINRMNHKPVVKKLLPLDQDPEDRVRDFEVAEPLVGGYIFEPDQKSLLEEIIPRFTVLQVFHAVIESLASEHSARMVAMKNATDNATDLADALQLDYNNARQQAITNEMLDIAGGAEAVAE
ncbi:MAG: ATP synthase F1 subunit gamma [Chloroflexi bacterium]|nr:ATP synthase F1 subunit gamma [Chloroflexota bacterium]